MFAIIFKRGICLFADRIIEIKCNSENAPYN